MTGWWSYLKCDGIFGGSHNRQTDEIGGVDE
jgi:hypothetical protein